MDNIDIEVNQAEIMLRLQDSINSKINSAWRDEKTPWYRAVWTECAELMDHVGWKWWKYQENDIYQMKLELVDIWHFGLSEVLAKTKNISEATGVVTQVLKEIGLINSIRSREEILSAVEDFALMTIGTKKFDLPSFIRLVNFSGLGNEELYKMYVGKNVLNTFRQDNGYKTGGYVKVWSGKEDNIWLSDIVNNLSINSPSFVTDLYKELENTYKYKS